MLLDPTYLIHTVDYSFGTDSVHMIDTGTTKVANGSNREFITMYWKAISTGQRWMTLFIDNVRLYKRKGPVYSSTEKRELHIQAIRDAKSYLYQQMQIFDLSVLDYKFIFDNVIKHYEIT